MPFLKRAGFVALFCSLAGGIGAIPGTPASAQGLLDGLFSPATPEERAREVQRQRQIALDRERRRQMREDRQRYLRRFGLFGNGRRANDEPAAQAYSGPRIVVRSPRYYTYKPDAPVTVSLQDLITIETASAEPLGPDDLAPLKKTPFTDASVHLTRFRLKALPEVGKGIRAYYTGNPEFIWVTNNRANGRAYAAMEALERADEYGLWAENYRVEAPAYDYNRDDMDARQRELIEFELRLSSAVLAYILDATRGRVDPNRISGYHDLKRKSLDLKAELAYLAIASDIGTYLDRRSPRNAYFNALKTELAVLRQQQQADNEEAISIALGTFVRPGSDNPELPNIIAAIDLRGSADLKTVHAETFSTYDGGSDYSVGLVDLVKDFQAENGLYVDGIIGQKTIRAMNVESKQTKIDKVLMAMERARWLPNDLGKRHVIVNQPAFRVTYMRSAKEPVSMRVVVGTKANQTSFFMDQIEKVEFNPYWGVPYSIIVNEMMPKLNQDPYYLDRLGYEVTTLSGQHVSSASVNWYSVASKKSSINVRQPPGPKNALGELKILFPNKHAIYMHDTPHKNLFEKDARAFSHGCIRLHDPRRMAAAVLDQSEGYVASRIAQGGNDTDYISRPIPIYVSYFTAWPTPDGDVRYYDDMYERDVYLNRAIKSTTNARRLEG